MVLEDTTTLDAILGRVPGPRLPSLPDGELQSMADLAAVHYTNRRPWEMGVPLVR